MRTVIFAGKNGEVLFQREHLSKRPSGNAAQVKKALRSGWHPEWVSVERPRVLRAADNNQPLQLPACVELRLLEGNPYLREEMEEVREIAEHVLEEI